MATKSKKLTLPEKRIAYSYPSRFGSHASMKVAELSEKLTDQTFVVLQDESGLYATKPERLDTRLVDPYRYQEPEIKAALLQELLPSEQILCQDGKITLAPKAEEN